MPYSLSEQIVMAKGSGKQPKELNVATVQTAAATSDGLTTGIIAAATTLVLGTSASADYIWTLPSVSSVFLGKEIKVYVGATGGEIRTPASSNETINGVDGDGTNEYALAANSIAVCVVTSATGWHIFTGGAAAPN